MSNAICTRGVISIGLLIALIKRVKANSSYNSDATHVCTSPFTFRLISFSEDASNAKRVPDVVFRQQNDASSVTGFICVSLLHLGSKSFVKLIVNRHAREENLMLISLDFVNFVTDSHYLKHPHH